MLKNIVILYHGGCSDGFGAAWAAWKKFGNRASYIPVHHGEPPPKNVKNRTVYLVDFMYPEKELKNLIDGNARVTGIDHHLKSKKTIRLTEDFRYDLSHSGAVLAWKYFHPKKPVPKLLQYIEDVDLWKFKLPHVKKLMPYWYTFVERNFAAWSKFARDLENKEKRNKYITLGKSLLRYKEQLIKEIIADRAYPVLFAGRKVFAVNSPVFESEIGHALCKKKPPFAVIWRQKGDTVRVSLRSNGKFDVNKLADRYGGGGHPEAAGFSLKRGQKIPWKNV